ncbi:MAG: glycosyltransferase [Cyanosarcina radialis HA8281-LM2]|jgi:UDP:flavonoid glycosyltransferase YjiC (YdhE family)|nr:glycosyltransferase [Cyanosarcina radialis HA8281-LM2]
MTSKYSGNYALFVSIPFVGHINPLLRQAEELVRRGWRVGIASTREIQNYVEADPCVRQGARFVDLGSAARFQDKLLEIEQEISKGKNFRQGSFQIVESLWLIWPLFFDELLKVVRQERPDILIVDFVTRGAIDLAEAEGIAVIINNPDLLTTISIEYLPPAFDVPLPYMGHSVRALPWHRQWSYPVLRWLSGRIVDLTIGRRLNQLRASRGLGKLSINCAWAKHTVMVNSAFGLEYPRPLPGNVIMVGPMLSSVVEPLSPEIEDWLGNGPPVVYVNLGTIALPMLDLVDRMYEAFAGAPFRVWWILRPQMQQLLPAPLAANIRIDAWGPPLLAILKHPQVRVFVSHCGINSTQESLAAGTPIVGIPMLADQFDMAMRVEDARVGLILNKLTFSASELRAAIERVLSDSSFLQPIPAIQESFRQAGGVARAADTIELDLLAY